jgi:hypothetical protein
MDANIQRALNDKLYDKRKIGALEYVSLSITNLHNTPRSFIDSSLLSLLPRGHTSVRRLTTITFML